MNYRTLTKKLRKLGCGFVRQGPGSHEIWWNPAQRKFTTIPWRPGHEDLPKGTIGEILRNLGLEPKDLRKV